LEHDTLVVKGVDLHTELIKRLQAWTPSRQPLTFGTGSERDARGPIEEKRRRRCPLHYWLSGSSKTITLSPLPLPCSGPEARPPPPDDLDDHGVIQTRHADEPSVLVALRLSRDGFDVQAWAN
jgi:hypothetical protein